MTKLEATMIDATTTVATTSPAGNDDDGVRRKTAANEVKGMLRANAQARTLTEEVAEGQDALGHERSEVEADVEGPTEAPHVVAGGRAGDASSSSSGIRLRTFEVVVSRVLSSLLSASSPPPAPMIDVWRMHAPLPSSVPLESLRSAFLRRTVGNESVRFATKSSISAADRCRYCRHVHAGCEDGGESSSSLSHPSQSCCWPFDVLPIGATVRSRHVRLTAVRARRKEAQIRSVILCVLDLLPRLRPPARRRHLARGEDLDGMAGSSPRGDEVDCDSSTCHVERAADEVELDGNRRVPARGGGNGRVYHRRPGTGRLQIVDFCGGSGHLALPLALLLPECDVVVVDLKADSLEILRRRARSLFESGKEEGGEQEQKQRTRGRGRKSRPRRPTAHTTPGENGEGGQVEIEAIIPGAIQPSCHLDGGGGSNVPNLYTYHGDVASFASRHDFDVGVALHACGEATDVVLNACIAVNAAFVLAPCCVGKLNHRRARDPYVYRATAGNDPTISYPQSRMFRFRGGCGDDNGFGAGLGVTEEEFHELASAADYGHAEDAGTPRNAVRRVAKTLVEWDRLCLAAEAGRPRGQQPPPPEGVDDETRGIDTCDDGGGGGGGGYAVMLTRMDPWDASPKNDILMGCPPPLSSPSEEDSLPVSPLGSPFLHETRKTRQHGGSPQRANPDCRHLQCQSLTPGEANIARLAAKSCPSSTSSRENGMPKLNDADDAVLADTRDPNADVQWAMHHLNVVVDRGENDLPATEESRGSSTVGAKHDGMEWTKDEVERVQRILEDFLSGDEKSDRSEDREGEVLRFPPGEGSRMRKLVHHLAELRGLHHVSRGKQSSKRYVVVSRKGGRVGRAPAR